MGWHFWTRHTSPAAQSVGALQIVSGDAQTISVGAVAAPLTVRAVDNEGAALAGVVVHWSIAAGKGTLSTDVKTTDANGLATVQFTAPSDPSDVWVTVSVLGVIPTTFRIAVQ